MLTGGSRRSDEEQLRLLNSSLLGELYLAEKGGRRFRSWHQPDMPGRSDDVP
jgi:hypothetical protein